MKQSKNVRIMLALLLVGLCYTFVCGNGGCGDTGSDPITISTEGPIENWNVTGVDTAIEKTMAPILDFGDDVVRAARDTEKEIIDWGIEGNISTID